MPKCMFGVWVFLKMQKTQHTTQECIISNKSFLFDAALEIWWTPTQVCNSQTIWCSEGNTSGVCTCKTPCPDARAFWVVAKVIVIVMQASDVLQERVSVHVDACTSCRPVQVFNCPSKTDMSLFTPSTHDTMMTEIKNHAICPKTAPTSHRHLIERDSTLNAVLCKKKL